MTTNLDASTAATFSPAAQAGNSKAAAGFLPHIARGDLEQIDERTNVGKKNSPSLNQDLSDASQLWSFHRMWKRYTHEIS